MATCGYEFTARRGAPFSTVWVFRDDPGLSGYARRTVGMLVKPKLTLESARKYGVISTQSRALCDTHRDVRDRPAPTP